MKMKKRTKRILFGTAVAGAASLAFVHSSTGKKLVSNLKNQIKTPSTNIASQPVVHPRDISEIEPYFPTKSRSVSLDMNDTGAGVMPPNQRNAILRADAAAKINRVGRGYLARKQVRTKKIGELVRQENISAIKRRSAARKIQKAARSYLQRKNEPDPEMLAISSRGTTRTIPVKNVFARNIMEKFFKPVRKERTHLKIQRETKNVRYKPY